MPEVIIKKGSGYSSAMGGKGGPGYSFPDVSAPGNRGPQVRSRPNKTSNSRPKNLVDRLKRRRKSMRNRATDVRLRGQQLRTNLRSRAASIGSRYRNLVR